MKTKVEELQKLCEPLIEYIKKNYHPYTEIAVSMDFIKIRSENLSIPNKVAEHAVQPPK